MANVEIQFHEILPRNKYAVSVLYTIKVDGKALPGGLKVDLIDSFLGKYRATLVPNVAPPRFGGANQALLPEIGRYCLMKVIRDMSPTELANRCKEGGANPVVLINNETFGDIATLDEVLDLIKKELSK